MYGLRVMIKSTRPTPHFPLHIVSKRKSRFKINWSRLLAHKFHIDLSLLENPLEEIKIGTFELNQDKAISTNGFPFLSFKKTNMLAEKTS